MKNFRDLNVWHKGHQLTLRVYKLTSTFPKSELFGLTSQIRRSAASIPANIAEGCGRGGSAELRQFLNMAMGSASELEYHLFLSHELGFIGNPAYVHLDKDVVEVKRMLTGLIQKL